MNKFIKDLYKIVLKQGYEINKCVVVYAKNSKKYLGIMELKHVPLDPKWKKVQLSKKHILETEEMEVQSYIDSLQNK